jgi:1,4-alpha-glucan branching enzyme
MRNVKKDGPSGPAERKAQASGLPGERVPAQDPGVQAVVAAPADLRAHGDLLVAGVHVDPHSVLGRHGRQVRAWRPDAVAVAAEVSGTRCPLELVHPAGLWAAEVSTQGQATDRHLLVTTWPGGTEHVEEDGYTAWPTLGEVDLHLMGEGRHRRLWDVLGAHHRTHDGVTGTAFAVWAPNARGVSVIGEFNLWDGRRHPMRRLGDSGVWELFLPEVAPGARYKLEVRGADDTTVQRADPLSRWAEVSPGTASIVCPEPNHVWQDHDWLERRKTTDWLRSPTSVYEVHLGSWRHVPEEGDRALTYLELADQLPDYVADLGFTHVELLPPAEHPFGGSWGYQVTGYFAPTSRFGSPDDFRALVDAFHARGIGVLIDWVPAHFPKDVWALAHFDGTALYEHADPRQGEHPDWGTLVFNFGRDEVRGFLIASALYWLEELHIDGLRVDAVASMLYLDYSRKEGEWVPNRFGGRENLEAVEFLKEMNIEVYGRVPGVITVAEESTSWPAVSRPTYLGGLGFGFKWNMGWMHDTLEHFSRDPLYRRYHQGELTFGLLYAFSESFVLPLSHDEVVHGKGSLLRKMPGDRWQQLANLRALYAWMWAHPGKQLLFMGCELAQEQEWSESRSLDWHLLHDAGHQGVQSLVRDLNLSYLAEPALWEQDAESGGFGWIDADDSDNSVLSFLRWSADGSRTLACVANLTPNPHQAYRIGLPRAGRWREVLNTDAAVYGGSGIGNLGGVEAAGPSWHGQPQSAALTLPPLAVVWLAHES